MTTSDVMTLREPYGSMLIFKINNNHVDYKTMSENMQIRHFLNMAFTDFFFFLVYERLGCASEPVSAPFLFGGKLSA